MAEDDVQELLAQGRRQLWARWEASVQETDQRLAADVRAGRVPVAALAVWEQWKAAERARLRLRPPAVR